MSKTYKFRAEQHKTNKMKSNIPEPGEKIKAKKDWSRATGMKFFFVLFCACAICITPKSP